jgi:Glyoxalase/Bleomycin resistance protein/Dioxygenase superfamily
MIQIELYTNYLEENTDLFQNCFGYNILETQTGFTKFDCGGTELMFFDPSLSEESDNHWDISKHKFLGIGVEVILVVEDIIAIHQKIKYKKYIPTDLTKKPWGSTEFEFKLKDGYLMRFKQI